MSERKNWSYSRLSEYQTCPRQYLLRKNKTPEPESDVLKRGIYLHKLAEAYINHLVDDVPDEFIKLEKTLKMLREKDAIAELQLGFSEKWKESGWSNWDVTQLRVKVDAYHIDGEKCFVYDWKSGKERDYSEQLELYGLSLLLYHPEIKIVYSFIAFIDTGTVSAPIVVKRPQLPTLKRKWSDKTKPLFTDKIFAPRMGMHCGWCNFSKKKGGPCSVA